MKITFLGAAGEVTGSQHLLETSDRRVLLDCGLFQGPRALSRQKNERFHCRPKDLDAVILSHAHTDHVGNLPGLYRAGFRGPVFSTAATMDVAEVMLLDGAKIQAEDVRYLARTLRPGHPPIEPLYDEADVRGLIRKFEPLTYGEWHELGPGFKLRFSDAGHILGSALTELHLKDKGDIKRITFTGDLGRRDMPLLKDPELLGGCDVLITESTYGNRVHPPSDDLKTAIIRILKEAVTLGGKVIVPAFSLGRTQQLVYFLNELFNAGQLPHIPVFVDSPLSRTLTNVFRRHMDVLDEQFRAVQATDRDPFGYENLTYVATRDESVALNRREGPFVVISASGMCESGRVVHHLKHAVADERNTIMLIGYQAPYTLGRQIANRRPYVRIFDREYPLKAHVEQLEGLSAHADVQDFKWWFEHMSRDEGIGQAFIVHGEPDAATALAGILKPLCNDDPVIPRFGETFEV
jgi:metallo-beta-lactamase family protein